MSSLNSSITVNPRQQRGEQIAATFTLRQQGGDWLVPSLSGADAFRVQLDEPHPTCTGPNH
jgi:hypothetical protein